MRAKLAWRLSLAGLVLAVIACMFSIYVRRGPPPEPPYAPEPGEASRQLRVGMTEREATRLLGSPSNRVNVPPSNVIEVYRTDIDPPDGTRGVVRIFWFGTGRDAGSCEANFVQGHLYSAWRFTPGQGVFLLGPGTKLWTLFMAVRVPTENEH